MFFKPNAIIFCSLLLLTNACGSKSVSQSTMQPASAVPASVAVKSEPTAPAVATADACALVEKSEVAAVQGQPVGDAKSSRQEGEQFAVSQCFYQATPFDRSVSLALMQRGPKNADRDAMKEFWARFRARKGGDEEEEEGNSEGAKSVAGVGDEAYWVGNGKVGVLYVLKGESVVRVSVGGPDDSKTKIEKSKKLAAKALKRLG